MVKIYSTSWCPSCVYAKRLLEENNIEFKEVNIEEEKISREQLLELTGGMSVPQIVINGQSIGGFENLLELTQSGKLSELLTTWNFFRKIYCNIVKTIHLKIPNYWKN